MRERDFPVLGTKEEEIQQAEGRNYAPYDRVEVRPFLKTLNAHGRSVVWVWPARCNRTSHQVEFFCLFFRPMGHNPRSV